ncbi:nucleotidyltransferase domain-containing protein (plasmid) [Paraburkholderia sp. PREW-6R]|uniref:nucleotidyltransferase domain-containing protein n=1 Tax=Paraburkholderia sp. PREW-6R TaxID=3141544 RepID=UPI0031F55314
MRFADILTDWRGNPSTTRQIALLERISAALDASSDCTAAAVVGSFAKGTADRVSDIDLVVFCADGAGNVLLHLIEQQITPSEIFLEFGGVHDPKSPYKKLIFEDLTSVEFHVIAPDTELIIEQPFVEIVNHDHYLESRMSSNIAPTEHDMTAYRYGDRLLAWELFTCLKWLWRGDFKAVKRYLVDLGRAIKASEETDGSAVG